MNQMEREALEAALRSDSPPLLLEALPPRYYDDAHLPGAIRIDEERVVEQPVSYTHLTLPTIYSV